MEQSKGSLDQAVHLIPSIIQELQEHKSLLHQLLRQEAVPTLLTEEETAAILRIARSTLRKWVGLRRISVIKLGGNRFDPKDLLLFIQKNRIKGSRN